MILAHYIRGICSNGTINKFIIIHIRLNQVKAEMCIQSQRVFTSNYRLDDILSYFTTHFQRENLFVLR